MLQYFEKPVDVVSECADGILETHIHQIYTVVFSKDSMQTVLFISYKYRKLILRFNFTLYHPLNMDKVYINS